MKKSEIIVYTALCLIWSTTWLAIRVGVRFLPPFGFAGLRFLIGAAALALFLLARPPRLFGVPFPWRSIFLSGFLQFFVSYGLVFWCEQDVSAGFASIAFASIPLFVSLFARILAKEKLHPKKVLGVSLGFVGIFFLFFDQFGGKNIETAAEVGLLIGAAASALANVNTQRYQRHVPPRLNATTQMSIGCVLLLITSLVYERQATYTWNMISVISLLFLAIFGSAIAFVMYYGSSWI